MAYGATPPAFEVSGMKEADGSRVYLTPVPLLFRRSFASFIPSPHYPDNFTLTVSRAMGGRVVTHGTSYDPSFQVARLVSRTLENDYRPAEDVGQTSV